MPSGKASGEELRRISHALHYWGFSGYVEWNRRSTEWVWKNLDRTRYSTKEVGRLIHEHVAKGGTVRRQTDDSGEFEQSVWFNVVLSMDGQDIFVKFVLEPDEESDPGIVIVSIHHQLS